MVKQAMRAWNILVEKVTYVPLVEQVARLGSPREGWKYIVDHYTVCPTTEKNAVGT